MVFFYLSGFVRSPSHVGGNISYCWCKIYTIISHLFGVFFFTINIMEIWLFKDIETTTSRLPNFLKNTILDA